MLRKHMDSKSLACGFRRHRGSSKSIYYLSGEATDPKTILLSEKGLFRADPHVLFPSNNPSVPRS